MKCSGHCFLEFHKCYLHFLTDHRLSIRSLRSSSRGWPNQVNPTSHVVGLPWSCQITRSPGYVPSPCVLFGYFSKWKTLWFLSAPNSFPSKIFNIKICEKDFVFLYLRKNLNFDLSLKMFLAINYLRGVPFCAEPT